MPTFSGAFHLENASIKIYKEINQQKMSKNWIDYLFKSQNLGGFPAERMEQDCLGNIYKINLIELTLN